jgi:hypothetical protein
MKKTAKKVYFDFVRALTGFSCPHSCPQNVKLRKETGQCGQPVDNVDNSVGIMCDSDHYSTMIRTLHLYFLHLISLSGQPVTPNNRKILQDVHVSLCMCG